MSLRTEIGSRPPGLSTGYSCSLQPSTYIPREDCRETHPSAGARAVAEAACRGRTVRAACGCCGSRNRMNGMCNDRRISAAGYWLQPVIFPFRPEPESIAKSFIQRIPVYCVHGRCTRESQEAHLRRARSDLKGWLHSSRVLFFSALLFPCPSRGSPDAHRRGGRGRGRASSGE